MLLKIKLFLTQFFKKATVQPKSQKEIATGLIQGYRFIKWAENQLPNRQQKKQFRQDLIRNGIANNRYVKLFVESLEKYLQENKTK